MFASREDFAAITGDISLNHDVPIVSQLAISGVPRSPSADNEGNVHCIQRHINKYSEDQHLLSLFLLERNKLEVPAALIQLSKLKSAFLYLLSKGKTRENDEEMKSPEHCVELTQLWFEAHPKVASQLRPPPPRQITHLDALLTNELRVYEVPGNALLKPTTEILRLQALQLMHKYRKSYDKRPEFRKSALDLGLVSSKSASARQSSSTTLNKASGAPYDPQSEIYPSQTSKGVFRFRERHHIDAKNNVQNFHFRSSDADRRYPLPSDDACDQRSNQPRCDSPHDWKLAGKNTRKGGMLTVVLSHGSPRQQLVQALKGRERHNSKARIRCNKVSNRLPAQQPWRNKFCLSWSDASDNYGDDRLDNFAMSKDQNYGTPRKEENHAISAFAKIFGRDRFPFDGRLRGAPEFMSGVLESPGNNSPLTAKQLLKCVHTIKHDLDESYSITLRWLYRRTAASNGPAGFRKILKKLGSPEKHFKAVVIAGAHAKSSVAVKVSTALTVLNQKTGLFLCPHLLSCRERVSVDGRLITKSEFVHRVAAIREAISTVPHGNASVLEVLLLTAILQFKAHHCDFAVIEAGTKGSRTDPVSTFDTPILTVITAVEEKSRQRWTSFENMCEVFTSYVKRRTPTLLGSPVAKNLFLREMIRAADSILHIYESNAGDTSSTVNAGLANHALNSDAPFRFCRLPHRSRQIAAAHIDRYLQNTYSTARKLHIHWGGLAQVYPTLFSSLSVCDVFGTEQILNRDYEESHPDRGNELLKNLKYKGNSCDSHENDGPITELLTYAAKEVLRDCVASIGVDNLAKPEKNVKTVGSTVGKLRRHTFDSFLQKLHHSTINPIPLPDRNSPSAMLLYAELLRLSNLRTCRVLASNRRNNKPLVSLDPTMKSNNFYEKLLQCQHREKPGKSRHQKNNPRGITMNKMSSSIFVLNSSRHPHNSRLRVSIARRGAVIRKLVKAAFSKLGRTKRSSNKHQHYVKLYSQIMPNIIEQYCRLPNCLGAAVFLQFGTFGHGAAMWPKTYAASLPFDNHILQWRRWTTQLRSTEEVYLNKRIEKLAARRRQIDRHARACQRGSTREIGLAETLAVAQHQSAIISSRIRTLQKHRNALFARHWRPTPLATVIGIPTSQQTLSQFIFEVQRMYPGRKFRVCLVMESDQRFAEFNSVMALDERPNTLTGAHIMFPEHIRTKRVDQFFWDLTTDVLLDARLRRVLLTSFLEVIEWVLAVAPPVSLVPTEILTLLASHQKSQVCGMPPLLGTPVSGNIQMATTRFSSPTPTLSRSRSHQITQEETLRKRWKSYTTIFRRQREAQTFLTKHGFTNYSWRFRFRVNSFLRPNRIRLNLKGRKKIQVAAEQCLGTNRFPERGYSKFLRHSARSFLTSVRKRWSRSHGLQTGARTAKYRCRFADRCRMFAVGRPGANMQRRGSINWWEVYKAELVQPKRDIGRFIAANKEFSEEPPTALGLTRPLSGLTAKQEMSSSQSRNNVRLPTRVDVRGPQQNARLNRCTGTKEKSLAAKRKGKDACKAALTLAAKNQALLKEVLLLQRRKQDSPFGGDVIASEQIEGPIKGETIPESVEKTLNASDKRRDRKASQKTSGGVSPSLLPLLKNKRIFELQKFRSHRHASGVHCDVTRCNLREKTKHFFRSGCRRTGNHKIWNGRRWLAAEADTRRLLHSSAVSPFPANKKNIQAFASVLRSLRVPNDTIIRAIHRWDGMDSIEKKCYKIERFPPVAQFPLPKAGDWNRRFGLISSGKQKTSCSCQLTPTGGQQTFFGESFPAGCESMLLRLQPQQATHFKVPVCFISPAELVFAASALWAPTHHLHLKEISKFETWFKKLHSIGVSFDSAQQLDSSAFDSQSASVDSVALYGSVRALIEVERDCIHLNHRLKRYKVCCTIDYSGFSPSSESENPGQKTAALHCTRPTSVIFPREKIFELIVAATVTGKSQGVLDYQLAHSHSLILTTLSVLKQLILGAVCETVSYSSVTATEDILVAVPVSSILFLLKCGVRTPQQKRSAVRQVLRRLVDMGRDSVSELPQTKITASTLRFLPSVLRAQRLVGALLLQLHQTSLINLRRNTAAHIIRYRSTITKILSPSLLTRPTKSISTGRFLSSIKITAFSSTMRKRNNGRSKRDRMAFPTFVALPRVRFEFIGSKIESRLRRLTKFSVKNSKAAPLRAKIRLIPSSRKEIRSSDNDMALSPTPPSNLNDKLSCLSPDRSISEKRTCDSQAWPSVDGGQGQTYDVANEYAQNFNAQTAIGSKIVQNEMASSISSINFTTSATILGNNISLTRSKAFRDFIYQIMTDSDRTGAGEEGVAGQHHQRIHNYLSTRLNHLFQLRIPRGIGQKAEVDIKAVQPGDLQCHLSLIYQKAASERSVLVICGSPIMMPEVLLTLGCAGPADIDSVDNHHASMHDRLLNNQSASPATLSPASIARYEVNTELDYIRRCRKESDRRRQIDVRIYQESKQFRL